MTIQQLREVHQARPFRPVMIELADGTRVNVPHPGFVAYHPTGRTITVVVSEEAHKIIDVMLVTAIHVGDGEHPSDIRSS